MGVSIKPTYMPAGDSVYDSGVRYGGKSQSKYDVGSSYSDINNLNAIRADRQPVFRQVLNTFDQMISTLVGQTLEAVGSLVDPIANMLGENFALDEGLTGVGSGILTDSVSRAPVYWDKESQGFGSLSYVLNRAPSLVSAAAMLIPGMGVARGVGWMARSAKLGTFLEKTGSIGIGALAMRHAENHMESTQTYQALMQDFVQGTNNTGANPEGQVLDPEKAKIHAKEGADVTYSENKLNYFFDVVQLALVMNPVSGLASKLSRGLGVTPGALASTIDYGYAVTKARKLLGAVDDVAATGGVGARAGTVIPKAGKFKKALLRGAEVFMPIGAQLTEGIEEGWNFISQQEGQRAGGISAGTLEDDGSTFGERITDRYMKDWQLGDAMFWGVLGGITFKMVGSTVNAKLNQRTITNEIKELKRQQTEETDADKRVELDKKIVSLQEDLKIHGVWNNVMSTTERLANLKQRERDISDYVEIVNDQSKTEFDKDAARESLIFKMVASGGTVNSIDLLIEDLKNPKLNSLLTEQLGISKTDRNNPINTIIESATQIKEDIEKYSGGSLRSVFQGRREDKTVDTELDVPGAVTDTTARRQDRFVREDARVGAFADPRLAVQLAYNDHMVRSLDRMNTKLIARTIEKQGKLNSGITAFSLPGVPEQGISINAQQFISLSSDLEALDVEIIKLEKDLKVYQEVGASSRLIEMQEKTLKEAKDLKDRKDKSLTDITKVIEENLENPVTRDSETPIAHISKLASGSSGFYSDLISSKIAYFNNQTKKQQLLSLSDQILRDPIAYERGTIEDFRKFDEYLAAKTEADKAKNVADKYITDELEKMRSFENDLYKTTYNARLAQYTDEVEAIPEPGKKGDYANNAYQQAVKQFEADKAAGHFPTDSVSKFNSEEFKRELWIRDAAAVDAANEVRIKNPIISTSAAIYRDVPIPPSIQNKELLFLKNTISDLHNSFERAHSRGFLPYNNLVRDLPGFEAEMEELGKLTAAIIDPNITAAELEGYKKRFVELTDKYGKLFNVDHVTEVLKVGSIIINNSKRIVDSFSKALTVDNEALRKMPALFVPRMGNPNLGEAQDAPVDLSLIKVDNKVSNFLWDFIFPKYNTVQEFADDIQATYTAIEEQWPIWEKELTVIKLETAGQQFTENVADDAILAEIEASLDMPLTPEQEAQLQESGELHPVPRYKIHKRHSGQLPGTNEQLIAPRVPYALIGGRPQLDTLGRRVSNSEYSLWDGHALHPDKGPGKGFVHQGSVLELKNIKRTFNGIEYTDIGVFNEGVFVTAIDTIVSLNNQKKGSLANITDPAYKAQVSATFDKRIEVTKSLIDKFNKMSNGKSVFIKMANPFVRPDMADSITALSSGGVYVGSVYHTKEDDKSTPGLGLIDAFGNLINHKGEAQLTIFSHGKLWVMSPDGSKRVSFKAAYPDIHIPDSELRLVTTTGWNREYNGFPVILLPTHTLTGNNKHLYLPYKLYNAHLGDDNMRSNKLSTGATMSARVFDVLMNPDMPGHGNEFQQLLKLAGLDWEKYDPNLSINDAKNRPFIDKVYNSNTLIDKIFKTFVYVFDTENEFHKTKAKNTRDYSHHIGVGIIKKDGKTFMKFNVSISDTNKDNPADVLVHWNSYAIQIVDEHGNFKPDFHNTTKKLSQTLELGMGMTGYKSNVGDLYVTVDPQSQIRNRFNDKLFRVDFEATRKRGNKGYRGLAFNDNGRLEANDYTDYIEYLQRVKGVTSTVYGIEHTTADKQDKYRSYYYDRQLFLNPASMTAASPAIDNAPGDNVVSANPANEITATVDPPAILVEEIELPSVGKITVQSIHNIADSKGVKWDSDADFMAKSKELTGEEHLDKMTPEQLKKVYDYLSSLSEAASAVESNVQQVRIAVPSYIQTSIEMRDSGLIEVSKDEKHWMIDGVPFSRVHSFLPPSTYLKTSGPTLSSAAGTQFHILAKDVFSGNYSFNFQDYNMSPDVYRTMVTAFNNMLANGEQVIGSNVVLWAIMADGTKVAGEVDLITKDVFGKIRIYDFKSVLFPLTADQIKAHGLQLSIYSYLKGWMSGSKADELFLVQSVITYESKVDDGNYAYISSVLKLDNSPIKKITVPYNPDAEKLLVTPAAKGSTPAVPVVESDEDRRLRLLAEKAEIEALLNIQAPAPVVNIVEESQEDIDARREKEKEANKVNEILENELTEEEKAVVQEVFEANQKDNETIEEFVASAAVAENNREVRNYKGDKSLLEKFKDILRKILKVFLVFGMISTVYVSSSSMTVPKGTYISKVEQVNMPIGIDLSTNETARESIQDYHQRVHPGTPSIVLDKLTRLITIFDSTGKIIHEGAALIGSNAGKDTTSGQAYYDLRGTDFDHKNDRVTSAGEFKLTRFKEYKNWYGAKYQFNFTNPDGSQDLRGIWAIAAFHATLKSPDRLAALASKSVADNSITMGCVAIGTEDYAKVETELGENAHIYVIPDTKNRSLYEEFLQRRLTDKNVTFRDFLKDKGYQESGKDAPKSDSKTLNIIALTSLLAFIKKRKEDGTPLTDSEIAELKARLEEINDNLTLLNKPDEASTKTIDNTNQDYNFEDDIDTISNEPSSMSSVSFPNSKTIMDVLRDPSRREHMTEDSVFIYESIDMVHDLISEILYKNRIYRGNKSSIKPKELIRLVKAELGTIISDYLEVAQGTNVTERGVLKTLGNKKRKNALIRAKKVQKVSDFLYWEDMSADHKRISGDFVGYFVLALEKLNTTNLIDVSMFEEAAQVNMTGNRFITNASIRLNPKATINTETKIVLSRLKEFTKIDKDGHITFKPVYNTFGRPKYFTLNSAIDAFQRMLDGTNPSKLLSKLQKLKDEDPFAHSLFNRIEATSKDMAADHKKGKAVQDRFLSMTISLLNQHRKLTIVGATVNPERTSKPLIINFPANRQGITEEILSIQQDAFIANFPNLFTITDKVNPNDNTKTEHQVLPKTQSIHFTEQAGKKYSDFELKIDNTEGMTKHSILRELYKQLESALDKGAIKLNFTFGEYSELMLNGKSTDASIKDVLHTVALFDIKNIIFHPSMKPLVSTLIAPGHTRELVFQNTVLKQIAQNINYFMDSRGVAYSSTADDQSSFMEYDPTVYRFVASQFARLGLVLTEDKETYWTVLRKLNTPLENTDGRYQFNFYDQQASSLKEFIMDRINTLFIEKLSLTSSFAIGKNYSDSYDGGSANVDYTINEPFESVRRAIEPFALAAHGDWHKFSNSLVRNVNNQSEYTYVPHNTLTLMLNDIKDPDSPYLAGLRDTSFGKYNIFLQGLTDPASNTERELLELEYINGSIIDDSKRDNPEDGGFGVVDMIGWSTYFKGERDSHGDVRRPGGYVRTFSDLTQMPVLAFEKNNVNLNFRRKYTADGTLDFDIEIPDLIDGGPNRVYERLFGIYRAEIDRVYRSTLIWNDINNKSLSEEAKELLIKDKGYLENIQFVRDKSGKIVGPGSGTKLYFFGKEAYDNPAVTGMFNPDGSMDTSKYSDNSDSLLRLGFKPFINSFLNQMIDDIYSEYLDLEGSFYTTNKVGVLDITYNYLNASSVQRVTNSLFNRLVKVEDENGVFRLPIDSLSNRITPHYDENYTNIPINFEYALKEIRPGAVPESLSAAEKEAVSKEWLQLKAVQRERELKTSRLAFAQMKYLIADRTINEFIAQSTFHQMAFDPANLGKVDMTYSKFLSLFNKRLNAMMAPGTGYVNDQTKDAYAVMNYLDVFPKDIKIKLSKDEIEALPLLQRDFIKEFKKEFANDPDLVGQDGSLPYRILNSTFIYYGAQSAEGKKKRLQDIGKMQHELEMTNGASFMTAREWAYQLVGEGILDAEQYHQVVNAAYGEGLTNKEIELIGHNIAIRKNVYAGPNILETGVYKTLAMQYFKDANLPLIKGLTTFKGSKMDQVRELLEQIEREREFDNGNVRNGLMLSPPSAHKVGYTRGIKLFNEDGSVNKDMVKGNVHLFDRDYHRKQQGHSDKGKFETSASVQSNKLIHANIPFQNRYSPFLFTAGNLVPEGLSQDEIEDYELISEMSPDDSEKFRNGLSNDQFQVSKYRAYSILFARELIKLSVEMGLTKNNAGEFIIENLNRFNNILLKHGINRYGISDNVTLFMADNESNTEAKMPLSFLAPGNGLQSVLMARLEKIFSKFKMPGGTYASTTELGLMADDDLASYNPVVKSKMYASEEAIYKDFLKSELYSKPVKQSDGMWLAEYIEVEPGETIVPWTYVDPETGELLKYENYVDENGKVRIGSDGEPMIEDAALMRILNRIPNTGHNASFALKVVRFLRPEVKDMIALAPEMVAIASADHDYDKWYTYMPNYTVDKLTGKIRKVQGVIHSTQKDIKGKLGDNLAIEAYVRDRLLEENPDYNDYLEAIEFNKEVITGADSSELGMKSAVAARTTIDDMLISMKKLEASEFAKYRKEYFAAGTFGRQSNEQLQNVIFDIHSMILLDPKTQAEGTTFLSGDLLLSAVNNKVTVRVGEEIEPITIHQAFDRSDTSNIGSFLTLQKSRADNNAKEKLTGIAAVGLTSLAVAQRNALSLNALWPQLFGLDMFSDIKHISRKKTELEDVLTGKQPEMYFPEFGFNILVTGTDGKIKNDDVIMADDVPHRSPFAVVNADGTVSNQGMLYSARARNTSVSSIISEEKDELGNVIKTSLTGQVYKAPALGRYRFDRIYVINNKGERVSIMNYAKSALQAVLDRMNIPIPVEMNFTDSTYSAWFGMLSLGYTDEASLLLMQDSIVKYMTIRSGEDRAEVRPGLGKVLAAIKTIAGILGMDVLAVKGMYDDLPDGKRHIITLLNQILATRYGGELTTDILTISESMLLKSLGNDSRISDKKLKGSEYESYKTDQLKILRTYLIASEIGQNFGTLNAATHQDSKGLSNNIVDFISDMEAHGNLFNMIDLSKVEGYQKGKGDPGWKFSTAVPMLAGVHRLSASWQAFINNSKIKIKERKLGWVPSHIPLSYNSGVVPANSILNAAAKAKLFYENGPLFAHMRNMMFKHLNLQRGTLGKNKFRQYLRKFNVNFISYILSDPDLFRNMFTSKEEYEFFLQFGRRIQTLPDTGLAVDPSWEMFNSHQSVATVLSRLAHPLSKGKDGVSLRERYTILEALIPKLNVSEKYVSSVILPGNARYIQDLGPRLAASLTKMYEHGDADVRALAKRLILYAYQSGGILSPRSYVQHIPPNILINIGMPSILKGKVESLSVNPKDSKFVKSFLETFVIHYAQHHPMDNLNRIPKELLLKREFMVTKEDGSVESKIDNVWFEEGLQRNVITINAKNPIFLKSRYKNSFLLEHGGFNWLRTVLPGADPDILYYQQLDGAGNFKYRASEYAYPYNASTTLKPIISLYAANRAPNSGNIFSGVVETGGAYGGSSDYEQYQLDAIDKEYKWLTTPSVVKLLEMSTKGTETVTNVIKTLKFNNIDADSSAVLGLSAGIATHSQATVKFVSQGASFDRMIIQPGYNPVTDQFTPVITVNIDHPKYGILNAEKPNDFNIHLFTSDFAHELSHMVTLMGIIKVLGDTKTPAEIRNRIDKLRKDNPGDVELDDLIKTVEGVMLLRDKVHSRLQNKRTKHYPAYKRFVDITTSLNKGERVSEEDQAFWEDNSHFRGFVDTDRNNNATSHNTLKEFVAYAWSDPKMQEMLNSIGDGKMSFWEKLGVLLVDILRFFGISLENAQEGITTLRDRFKLARTYSYDKIAIPGTDIVDTFSKVGREPDVIANIQPLSALQLALTNIMKLRDVAFNTSNLTYGRYVSGFNVDAFIESESGSSMSSITFNDEALNEDGVSSITEYIETSDDARRILKGIVRESSSAFNSQLASRMLLGMKSQPRFIVLGKDEIVNKFPDASNKKHLNMLYDSTGHTIYVNRDIEVNRIGFENLILEEIMHANAFKTLSEDSNLGQEWNKLFRETKEIMTEAGIGSRHLVNSLEFLNGIIRDAAFRKRLSGIIKSEESDSFLDRVMNFILSMFGFRGNKKSELNTLLNTANKIVDRGSMVNSNVSAMASAQFTDSTSKLLIQAAEGNKEDVPIEGLTTELENFANVPIVTAGTHFDKLLIDNPLYDHYIRAHIEKMRSIKSRAGKIKDRTDTDRLNREWFLYREYLSRIAEQADRAALFDVAGRELLLLSSRLDETNSLDELGEGIKLLTAWTELSDTIVKAVASGDLEPVTDKFTQNAILTIMGNAASLKSQYMGKLFDVFKQRALEEHVPPELLNGIKMDMAVQDIGALAANFIGLSMGTNPLEIVSDFIIRLSARKINTEWLKFDAEYKRKLKELGSSDLAWAFFMNDDGKMQIQSQYSQELMNKLASFRDEVSISQTEREPLEQRLRVVRAELKKERTRVNQEAYLALVAEKEDLDFKISQHKARTKTWDSYMNFMREHFVMDLMKVTNPDTNETKTIRYADMTEEERGWAMIPWNEFKEELKQSYTFYTDEGEVVDELGYDQALSKYDPGLFLEWVYDTTNTKVIPKKATMFFAVAPNEKWKNTTFYDKLSDKQKSFYDWFVSEYVSAHTNLPQEATYFGDYEREKILQNFTYTSEESASKLKYLMKDLSNWSADWFQVSSVDPEESTKLSSPLSHRPVERMRFKRESEIANKQQGYYKQGEDLPADLKDKLERGILQYNQNKILVNRKGHGIKRIVPAVFNPGEIFKEFKKMSLGFKYKREVEDVLATAADMALAAEVENKIKYKIPFSDKTTNWLGARLASSVDAYLYDKRADRIASRDIEEGERRFSIEQTFDTLNKFTRYRNLGLNFASGVTNLAMGTIGNYQYATRGEMFNESDLNWAYWKLKGSIAKFLTAGKGVSNDAKKIALILQDLNLMDGFLEESFVNKSDIDKLLNHLFFMLKGGEFLNQGADVLAMMHHKQLTKADGTTISLWDAYEVKNNELVFNDHGSEYKDPNKRALFGMAAVKVIKEIHGDYDPLSFKLANKKLIGRMILLFRNWLPMAVKVRFGKREDDDVLGLHLNRKVIREGRWRTLGTAVRGYKGSRNSVTTVAMNVLRVAGGVAATTVSSKLARKVMGEFNLTTRDEVDNMAVMAKEIWWMMAIGAMGAIFKRMRASAEGDDEDDAEVAFLTYLYNQSARIDNDLWFYYNPVSAAKVVRDPIAVWGTLHQALKVTEAFQNYITDHDADIYKKGMRKGDSKFWTQFQMFWPVIRQKQTLWSMWSNPYPDSLVR